MNKDIAKKWVRALRGKHYKQGRGALKVKAKDGTVRHCCLGVLCELYRKETGDMTAQPLDAARNILIGRSIKTLYGFTAPGRDHEFIQCLPPTVQKWAEMYDEEGAMRNYENDALCIAKNGAPLRTLTDINDRGYSFKTIADIIETRAEDL